MKKKLIVLVSALFAFEGLVAMDNVKNADENSLQRPKITSLSGGMEILPGMRSEKLYFKPIIYPREWDQYKGLSQMNILDEYLLEIANVGTDDPTKLFGLMRGLSNAVDWDTFFDETNQSRVDDFYEAIHYMIYARALELGVWDAHFVTLGFVGSDSPSLRFRANYLIYNESPVSSRVLAIAALYIDLLCSIKNSKGKDSLEFFPNILGICRRHPQLISSMVEEIKNAPFPTTKYFSWAFEKALDNFEAQKQRYLFSE